MSASRGDEVRHLPAYQRLKRVSGSPIFGAPSGGTSLFPAGVDSLAIALGDTFPQWSIEAVTTRAYEIARGSDDYSLVALAALARDTLVLTALRETAVLYALAMGGSAMTHKPVYEWRIDPLLADRALLFIQEFNRLFAADLPLPVPANAQRFWVACQLWKVVGRCVRIGFDDRQPPTRHYH